MRFSTKQEGWFSIGAAVLVVLTAFWDPRVAAVFGAVALVAFAWHEFAKQGGPTPSELKERNKRTVLNLFNGRTEVTNNDVEMLLGVSDATATNYLQELEDEGKIRQVGTVGRAVRYRRR